MKCPLCEKDFSIQIDDSWFECDNCEITVAQRLSGGSLNWKFWKWSGSISDHFHSLKECLRHLKLQAFK